MHDRSDNDLYAAFRFAGDIQPEPRQWLWPARIPLGKLTLLIGDPAVGKSLLAADLAARVSAPHPWPDPPEPQPPIGNRPSPNPEPRTLNPEPSMPPAPSVASLPHHGGVVLVCPEDGPADTLRPRLAAAGADLTSVCILEGATETLPSSLPPEPRTLNPEPSLLPFTLPTHAHVLEQAIRAVSQPRLVILDPLHAVLSPDAQASIDAVVACLAQIAHTYAVAIIAVGHLVKARSHRMLYRVRGSLTLVAAARAVHLLSADPNDPHRRILSPLKTVYGPPPTPLAFRITPETRWCENPFSHSQPRLEWESPLVRESLLAPTPAGIPSGPWHLPTDLLDLSPDARSALSDACAWLFDFLAPGPRPARQILREARAAGVNTASLRRAKRILAVRSLKPTVESPWLWSRQQRSDNEGAQLGSAQT